LNVTSVRPALNPVVDVDGPGERAKMTARNDKQAKRTDMRMISKTERAMFAATVVLLLLSTGCAMTPARHPAVSELEQMHQRLGIDPQLIAGRALPQFAVPQTLVDAGTDLYGRDQQMTPQTLGAWRAMLDAAAADDIQLLLVSAFRTLEYQARIIERKLAGGAPIHVILKTNAPPGYSEHHTGRALDLACPDDEPLEETFDATAAFDWLTAHADRFGFALSYPRGNPEGFVYEPWHWCFEGAGRVVA
jgi:D-alanyl-D-alanine carboxypeptidase